MFELASIDALPTRVKQLFADEDLMQWIADNGYKKALVHCCWQARAREIDESLLSLL